MQDRRASSEFPEAKRLLGALANSRGHRHEENAAKLVNAALELPLPVAVALLASAEGYTPRATQLIEAAREKVGTIHEVAEALAENLPPPKLTSGRSRRRKRRKRKKTGSETPQAQAGDQSQNGDAPAEAAATAADAGAAADANGAATAAPKKRRRRRKPKPAAAPAAEAEPAPDAV